MIGLIILIVGVIYFAVLVVVTRGAYRWAKGKGLSKAKCRLAAAGGFLAVYLPVFWDHIPTVIAHEYYCKTEAGFWVYKTPEQWKKENPGVAETLTYSSLPRLRVDPDSGLQITYLNNRLETRRSPHRLRAVPVTVYTDVVVDLRSNEVLAKHVGVGAGYGNMMVGSDWRSMKFWLGLGSCEGESMPLYGQYESIRRSYQKIGEKK
jgi:hypothetical protein